MLGILRSRTGGRNRRPSSEPPVYFSVIDPGTTSLRVLIVEVSEGQSMVWGWAESPGWAGADTEPGALLAACEGTLGRAESMAQDRSDHWFLPDQMLVGLSAAQLRGRAWPVTQRRTRPRRPVEEQELTALLGRALRLAVNRLIEPDDPDWLLIDALPVAFTVDGRGVTDPVGFRGREIGATVFAALSRPQVVEAWQMVAEGLEFSTLTVSALPVALAASLPESQGVLLDVGGATTDLTWWRAGRPVALESLPVGGAEVTRALVRKWGLSPERAERLKRAYAGGRLDGEARSQVLEVMSPALQTWLAETEAALVKLGQGAEEPLPQRLRLLGGGSALPEMAESVRALAWSQRLHFARYPQVDRLRPTDVPGVVNRTDLGWEAGDAPVLALAAWAARQSKQPDRPTQILSELCN